MAGAADQAFDMNFSQGAPSAAAPAPAPPANQGSAADQAFDMNFSGGGGAGAPAAPASSQVGYYASLTSDYADRTKAESAARAAVVAPKSNLTHDLAQGAQEYWSDLSAPAVSAWKNVEQDVSAPIGTHNGLKTAGDVGALALSPITGLFNAEVVQPGAAVLDQLPAPQKFQGGLTSGKFVPMTKAEQHAQNEQIISTALSGVGPEGAEGGAAAKFATAKNASNLAGVVTNVPADVALDASGKLTDEGLEYAAKANVQPKDLEAAYKAARYAGDVAPKPPAPDSAAAEPAPQPAPAPLAPAAANDAALAAPVDQAPQASAPPAPEPDQAATPSAGPSAIWRNGAEDHPVEVTGAPQAGPDGRSFTPVRSQVHGGEGYVPTADLAPPVQSAVRVGPNGLTEFGERPQDVPTDAEGRAAEAQSIGVKLSEGQATQDSAILDQEERLRADLNAPDSAAANQFKAQQASSIADAVDNLKQSISDPTLTAEDRGNLLQSALRQLHENGKAGVSAVYDQLRKLGEALGDRGSNLLQLDTGDLKTAIRNVLIDENVDPQARAALKQQAAQYGLIGGAPKIYEDGSSVVKLLDQDGKEGPPVQLPRAPEPLTIQNAEGLRQAINRIYNAHETPEVLGVKPALDKAVDDALGRAVNSDEAREFVQTAEKARALHRQVKDTFDANDIVSDLIAWKKEGVTPKVDPEKAMDRLFQGGKNAISPLKRIKAVLLNDRSPQSLEAWQHIKGQAIEKIFDQARVINANGGRGAISGAKLQTAITNFGVEKLRAILDENEFNQLMKIRRVSVNAGVMPDYIVNNSNSANIFQRYFAKHGRSLRAEAASEIPVVGGLVKAADEIRMLAAEDAANKKTLNGILNYKPPAKP